MASTVIFSSATYLKHLKRTLIRNLDENSGLDVKDGRICYKLLVWANTGPQVTDNHLKITKRRQTVTLVLRDKKTIKGDVFLHYSRNEYGLPQEPMDLLNSKQPFMVLMDKAGEVSFYNKRMVSHLIYHEETDADKLLSANLKENVAVELVSGEVLYGEITALLPPENMRLYDFLNQPDECFMRVKNAGGIISLINKSCITTVNETY